MADDPKTPLSVAALYKFVKVDDPQHFISLIDDFARPRGIKGTILVAPEGINGTVAGDEGAISELIAYLREGNVFKGAFRDLAPKYSGAEKMPFMRLKVRLKREIVTLRAENIDPTREVGTYVAPHDWNALIEAPDVKVVDTRNNYETAIGTFKGAIDPATENFTEFKDFAQSELDPSRDKKVAMFCTGGIRCEKASAYLLSLGFEEVYHLEGGILKYLEEIPEEDSQWEGACFVFDDRVGVGHGLEPSEHQLCHACRWPVTEADRVHADYIEGVQCPRCKDTLDDATRAKAIERQRQITLAAQRGEAHMGDAIMDVAEARRAEKAEQKERSRATSSKQ